MNSSWHAGPELLARYAAGELSHSGQAAVETHLTECPSCRMTSRQVVQPDGLDVVWDGIATRIAAPRFPLPLRLLHRLGVPNTDLVVIRASSSMWLAWALAMLGAILFAMLTGSLSTYQQELFYGAVAPLLPALLVAGAYDSSDPTRELMAATPFSKLRMALLRTALAVAGALPVVVLMSMVVPGLVTHGGAWLLPSLALTVLALTLLTWWTAPVTVGVLSSCWILVVAVWAERGSLDMVATAGIQVAFAAATLLAASALAGRLTHVRLPGGRP
jgi:Putative zinc-finger